MQLTTASKVFLFFIWFGAKKKTPNNNNKKTWKQNKYLLGINAAFTSHQKLLTYSKSQG